ncbi:hypothetical protein CFP56_040346 [Quercus suber]|uniref:PGG domain-containing protein n=1 Tax=Quercus suber TaxID=58331 RepID=A0AAW0LMD0_QUESU
MAKTNTAFVQSAAFHSLWMTFPSQCNKSNFLKLILHLLFAKTEAFYSYYNAQNEIKWLYLPASNLFSSQLAIEKVMRHFERLNFKKCQRLPEKAQIIDSQFKAMISMMETYAKTSAIVNALIATVTFAAGITVPGGFFQDGRNAGSAILTKNDSFKAFIIIDTIALVLSTSALFIYLIMPIWIHTTRVTFAVRRLCTNMAANLTILATGTMVLTFVTGSFAVLAHAFSLTKMKE